MHSKINQYVFIRGRRRNHHLSAAAAWMTKAERPKSKAHRQLGDNTCVRVYQGGRLTERPAYPGQTSIKIDDLIWRGICYAHKIILPATYMTKLYSSIDMLIRRSHWNCYWNQSNKEKKTDMRVDCHFCNVQSKPANINLLRGVIIKCEAKSKKSNAKLPYNMYGKALRHCSLFSALFGAFARDSNIL